MHSSVYLIQSKATRRSILIDWRLILQIAYLEWWVDQQQVASFCDIVFDTFSIDVKGGILCYYVEENCIDVNIYVRGRLCMYQCKEVIKNAMIN